MEGIQPQDISLPHNKRKERRGNINNNSSIRRRFQHRIPFVHIPIRLDDNTIKKRGKLESESRDSVFISMEEQQKYIEQTTAHLESLKRYSIFILGEPKVGKSAFIQSLLSIDMNFSSNEHSQLEKRKIPQIITSEGMLTYLSQPTGRDYILNIHDFECEEINSDRYKLTITSNAIYVLLIDAIKSLHENKMVDWINTISTTAAFASVFLVAFNVDHPNAFQNTVQMLSQLSKIIENQTDISKSSSRSHLHYVSPSEFHISLSGPCNIPSLPIWPIKYPNSSPSSSLSSSSSPNCFITTSVLNDCILQIAEKKIPKMIDFPNSWIQFRSILLPERIRSFTTQSPENKHFELISNDLYSEPSYHLRLIKKSTISKYAARFDSIETSQHSITSSLSTSSQDISMFIEVLETIGDLKYIRNSIVDDDSIIILNPSPLLSILKQLSSPPTTKNDDNDDSSHPFIITTNDEIQNILKIMMNDLSTLEIKHLVDHYVIPIFLQLRFLYPLLNNTYIIPSSLPSTPFFPQLRSFPSHQHSFTPTSPDVVFIERTYNLEFLPSSLQTQFMMEIWRFFAFHPEFASLLHPNDHKYMFWKTGFLLTSLQSSSQSSSSLLKSIFEKLFNGNGESKGMDDNDNNNEEIQLCIVQIIQNGVDGKVSLQILVRSPISKVGTIMPILHSYITETIISPLEFNTRRYSCRIACYASMKNMSTSSPSYSKCFELKLQNTELSYLIPELYYHNNQSQFNDDNARYYKEVVEITELMNEKNQFVVISGNWRKLPIVIKKSMEKAIMFALKETFLLKLIHHPSIVKLYDCYIHSRTSKLPPSYSMILEHCGDTLQYNLQKDIAIHPIIMCCIIRDIAEGLSYLHNHSPPIIHGNIGRNKILIKSLYHQNGDVCAVIGSFKSARIADPFTRTAGSISIHTDVKGLLKIIQLFISYQSLSKRDNSTINTSKQSDRHNDDGIDNVGLKDRVREKFLELATMIESMNFDIDTKRIATILSTDLITPYYDAVSSKLLHESKYVKEIVIETILSSSHHFSNLQNFILNSQPYSHSTIYHLLTECLSHISTLKSEIQQNEEQYWVAICRYVTPLIGYAIEEHILNDHHLNQLNDLQFNFTVGDFDHQMTLLHHACRSANLRIINQLIPYYQNSINERSLFGSAAIHFAIHSLHHHCNHEGELGTIKLVETLLSSNADINLPDYQGETLIFKAAILGSSLLLSHLLKISSLYVDVHAISKDSITAIIAAARGSTSRHRECIKALLLKGSELSPSIRSAMLESDLKIIQSEVLSLLSSDDNHHHYIHPSDRIIAFQSWFPSPFHPLDRRLLLEETISFSTPNRSLSSPLSIDTISTSTSSTSTPSTPTTPLLHSNINEDDNKNVSIDSTVENKLLSLSFENSLPQFSVEINNTNQLLETLLHGVNIYSDVSSSSSNDSNSTESLFFYDQSRLLVKLSNRMIDHTIEILKDLKTLNPQLISSLLSHLPKRDRKELEQRLSSISDDESSLDNNRISLTDIRLNHDSTSDDNDDDVYDDDNRNDENNQADDHNRSTYDDGNGSDNDCKDNDAQRGNDENDDSIAPSDGGGNADGDDGNDNGSDDDDNNKKNKISDNEEEEKEEEKEEENEEEKEKKRKEEQQEKLDILVKLSKGIDNAFETLLQSNSQWVKMKGSQPFKKNYMISTEIIVESVLPLLHFIFQYHLKRIFDDIFLMQINEAYTSYRTILNDDIIPILNNLNIPHQICDQRPLPIYDIQVEQNFNKLLNKLKSHPNKDKLNKYYQKIHKNNNPQNNNSPQSLRLKIDFSNISVALTNHFKYKKKDVADITDINKNINSAIEIIISEMISTIQSNPFDLENLNLINERKQIEIAIFEVFWSTIYKKEDKSSNNNNNNNNGSNLNNSNNNNNKKNKKKKKNKNKNIPQSRDANSNDNENNNSNSNNSGNNLNINIKKNQNINNKNNDIKNNNNNKNNNINYKNNKNNKNNINNINNNIKNNKINNNNMNDDINDDINKYKIFNEEIHKIIQKIDTSNILRLLTIKTNMLDHEMPYVNRILNNIREYRNEWYGHISLISLKTEEKYKILKAMYDLLIIFLRILYSYRRSLNADHHHDDDENDNNDYSLLSVTSSFDSLVTLLNEDNDNNSFRVFFIDHNHVSIHLDDDKMFFTLRSVITNMINHVETALLSNSLQSLSASSAVASRHFVVDHFFDCDSLVRPIITLARSLSSTDNNNNNSGISASHSSSSPLFTSPSLIKPREENDDNIRRISDELVEAKEIISRLRIKIYKLKLSLSEKDIENSNLSDQIQTLELIIKESMHQQ